MDLTDAERNLQRYNAIQERANRTTEATVAIGERLRDTVKEHVVGDKDRTAQIEKLTNRLQQLKKIERQQLNTIKDFDIELSPDLSFVIPEISPEKLEKQMELLFSAANLKTKTKVPAIIEPDLKIDTEKVAENIEPLKQTLSNAMVDAAMGATEALGPAMGPAVRSLLDSSLKQVGNAAGEEGAQAVVEGFNGAVAQLLTNKLEVDKMLSAEGLCIKAEEAGKTAASCLSRAFVQKMEDLERVLSTAGNVLGGLESLMAANESREMDRISRSKARNTTEIDILKSRLQNAKTLTQSEIGLYNKQVSSLNARNRSLDIAAAAAEAKACKRAKKFAVLQGAIAVAAAWSAAAKAGSFAAGAGPLAFFTGFGSVLAAGLGAAAQIAKFDCNKIGSTSGGGGGGGLGGGGTAPPAFNQTQRAGADLNSFDPNRGRPQKVINLTLNGDRFNADDIVDIVTQINDGDAQINADRVAGVF